MGIPTFRRPQGLLRLLDSIALQQVDFDVQVVVADNDSEQQQGVKAVQSYREKGFPFPLHVNIVQERGISQVRNSLIEIAFDKLDADLLAMLDDDEIAERNWLDELVSMQLATGAHVVGGHVTPEFEGEVPNWLQGLAIYYQDLPSLNGVVDLIEGTTNVLMHKAVVRDFPEQKFDLYYSLVGGGDKEFFQRLKLLGATFAFAEKARSHEYFSASRLTKAWAKERSFRIGAGDMRIILKYHRSATGMILELLKLVFAAGSALCQMIIYSDCAHKKMAATLLFYRQKGKVSALFGKQKAVYKNTHGS